MEIYSYIFISKEKNNSTIVIITSINNTSIYSPNNFLTSLASLQTDLVAFKIKIKCTYMQKMKCRS